MDYRGLVEDGIAALDATPVDILGIGDAEGERRYLQGMRESYVRTIRDVDQHFAGNRGRDVLEVGSFLGLVSFTLARLGYRVSAADIPEFEASASLRGLYERNGVPFRAVNLRDYHLPYETGSFDAIVVCEVLEHLNFNPLPVIAEFNRVLKPGGLLYIGMPNQAALTKRIGLLLGKSCNNSISDFFSQLDPTSNMVVGLHWKEYTMAEVSELVERTGFDVLKAYFYAKRGDNALARAVKAVAYAVPSLRPFLVLMATKNSEPAHDFRISNASR